MRHIDPAMMIDLVEQRLAESERESCERHLSGCRRCAAEHDSWWTFLSGLGPSHLTDASTDLIDEGIAIYPKSKQPFLKFQRARVLFDSFLQPLPAMGLRGVATDDSRQVLIRMDGLDVHLKISGTGSSRTIQGQLLPSKAQTLSNGAQIEMRAIGQPSQFACSNTFGEFRFNGVPAGLFLFFVDLPSEGRIAEFSLQGG
jgi:hypothetical protein